MERKKGRGRERRREQEEAGRKESRLPRPLIMGSWLSVQGYFVSQGYEFNVVHHITFQVEWRI